MYELVKPLDDIYPLQKLQNIMVNLKILGQKQLLLYVINDRASERLHVCGLIGYRYECCCISPCETRRFQQLCLKKRLRNKLF